MFVRDLDGGGVMKYGYMRVSTDMQLHDLQESALKNAGCDVIYKDTISGKSTSREGLNACLEQLEEGDSLAVWKLDRLGRSVPHLIDIINGLGERGVDFISLTEHIDTTTPAGKLFFHMIASFAEFERDMISARTKAGIESAKARGVKVGRPAQHADEYADVIALLNAGNSYRAVEAETGISKSQIGYIKKHYA